MYMCIDNYFKLLSKRKAKYFDIITQQTNNRAQMRTLASRSRTKQTPTRQGCSAVGLKLRRIPVSSDGRRDALVEVILCCKTTSATSGKLLPGSFHRLIKYYLNIRLIWCLFENGNFEIFRWYVN